MHAWIANLLSTPEFVEIINNQSHTPCYICLEEGKSCNQCLSHVLNGCRAKYGVYTKRHYILQNVIEIHIKMLLGIDKIHYDKILQLDDMPNDLKRHRHDIISWFNNRSKCILVEISVLNACKRMNRDYLQTVYDQKK